MSKLEATQAIRDMLFRYCRGLDRMDKPLCLSVFHPESEVEIDAAFKGTGPEFVEWVWVGHSQAARHLHNITNLYVEVDGDTASSESYVIMIMRRVIPGGGIMHIRVNGRYVDEWVRYEDRWVIKKRLAIQEFQEIAQFADDQLPDEKCSARRDTSDPTYALNPPLRFG